MLFGGTYKEVMAMINTIGAPVYLVDVSPGGRFVGLAFNSRAEEYFGVSSETFIGRDLEDLAGLSDSQIVRRQRGVVDYRRCMERASPVTSEHRTPLEDETFKWGRFTFVPIFDEAGEIRRLMITITDITELKETQERLENTLTRVLSGFVTICATCKNIKEDSGQWVRVEHYLSSDINDVQFSHGYCPKCYESAVQELK